MTEATVYVTKYALTSGVVSMHGHVTPQGVFVHAGTGNLYGKSDWCLTAEEAQQRAEAMRMTRILSLQQQISRLRGMDYSCTNPHFT